MSLISVTKYRHSKQKRTLSRRYRVSTIPFSLIEVFSYNKTILHMSTHTHAEPLVDRLPQHRCHVPRHVCAVPRAQEGGGARSNVRVAHPGRVQRVAGQVAIAKPILIGRGG